MDYVIHYDAQADLYDVYRRVSESLIWAVTCTTRGMAEAYVDAFRRESYLSSLTHHERRELYREHA